MFTHSTVQWYLNPTFLMQKVWKIFYNGLNSMVILWKTMQQRFMSKRQINYLLHCGRIVFSEPTTYLKVLNPFHGANQKRIFYAAYQTKILYSKLIFTKYLPTYIWGHFYMHLFIVFVVLDDLFNVSGR